APFDAVTPAAAAAARAALGAAPGTPVAVHVGRFHHWKGQQVLLRALAQVPDLHAWFVGAPLFGEDAFDAELRALATALGVASRARFTGFRDDVPTLLRAADVVVHSSVYPEPFGRVVVEGMLAGRPVIAANAGGVPEIVTDGDTGILVPPGDPAALAAALRRVTADPAAAAAMGARGRARAREVFSVAAMVRGVRAALDEP
ncbi:MAG TPA: glycosyltransferase, partial [Gemmatimonadaceae bacterium]|nr:glycosyltransferase [Gemmatimonadaceae bacterium]